MKNFKLIIVLTVIVTAILSCSKKDDNVTLSFETLLVENSSWKFNGVELLNVVNTGVEEFDKDKFEIKIRETNENVFYTFNMDGTGEITDNNIAEAFSWEIIEGNKLKLFIESRTEVTIFNNLNVTKTELNFFLINIKVDTNVSADVKYILSKSNV